MVNNPETENQMLRLEMRRMREYLDALKAENDYLKAAPWLVGDVQEMLPDKRIVVRYGQEPTFVVYSADDVDKDALKPGTRVGTSPASRAVLGILPNVVDSQIAKRLLTERPDVTFEDIGGLEEQILELRETVELPLLHPELFASVGIDAPKGVLLFGPPGTGKTMLAKAVANFTQSAFIHVVGSELVQKYIGEGSRLVREMFDMAKEHAPSIIFIDEIDALARRRVDDSTSASQEVQRVMMQLLASMDGFDPLGNVRIIAATNRPDVLDGALLRPGRFDRLVAVPPPTAVGRVAIFRIHTKRMNLAPEVDLTTVAAKAELLTGADIKAICTEAGMFAIRDVRGVVTASDFERAVQKVTKAQTPKVTDLHHMDAAMFA